MNQSLERLRREIHALRTRGEKPEHWQYRIFLVRVPTFQVPSIHHELVHPQDHPKLLRGEMAAYYEARLDRSCARLITTETPNAAPTPNTARPPVVLPGARRQCM